MPPRPAQKRRPPPAPQGFTLLELLVAMAIFAVLAMMIHGGLMSVIRSREGIMLSSDRLAGLQIAFALLQRDLEQVTPRFKSGSSTALSFQGADGAIDFLELTHSRQGTEFNQLSMPLERVRYRFQDNTIQRTTWSPLDPAPGYTPFTMILIEGVAQTRVRFLDEKKSWTATWNQETLPLMMELTLLFGNGEQFQRFFRIAG